MQDVNPKRCRRIKLTGSTQDQIQDAILADGCGPDVFGNCKYSECITCPDEEGQQESYTV
jgi:hypothetical protein